MTSFTIDRLRPNQGTIFNVAFALAAFVLSAWLLPLSVAALNGGTRDALLGIAIVAALAAELFGLGVKLGMIGRLVHGGMLGDRDARFGALGLVLVVAWFCHLALGVWLALIAVEAFGFSLERTILPFTLATVLAVARELYILRLLVLPPSDPAPAGPRRVFLADCALLFLAVVAYWALWDVVTGRLEVHLSAGRPLAVAADIVIALVGFALVLLPLRLGFLPEERIRPHGRPARWALHASFAVAVVAGLAPIARF
jgi:hypothetical protein